MAAADWRSASLIASIRRRGNAPMSNEGWNDADFLAAINEEMRSYVVPLIRRTNEDYLVAYTDETTTTAARYRIPEAAMGESLKDVGFVVNDEFQPMERVSPGRSAVGGYYLEDEDVVLVPAPSSGQTLRMKYVRRPSKLVADSRAVSISTPNGGGIDVVALDSDYTGETSLGSSGTYDVISARPGFKVHTASLAATVSASVLTFNAGTLAVLSPDGSIGDYIARTGESPVPQIPAEAHPLLAQAVLCQYLKAADRPAADDRRKEMEADLVGLLAPRTENQPHRMVNQLSPGWSDFYGRRIGQD